MSGDEFSEKSENSEKAKNPKKGENLAKEKMEKINKDVSKDKRDEFKQEVVQNKKKRRRRPRRKKEKVEQKPQESQKSEEVQKPEAPVEPINPFDQNLPVQNEPEPSTPELPTPELPTPEHEDRFAEEELAEEPVEAVSEVKEEQMPINPFEAAEPPVSTIEKKALGDKPLDRKDHKFEKDKFESEKKDAPEIIKQAVEEVDQVAEQMGEEGAANEAEAADVAETAKESAVVAEVVEAKPEQSLEGMVQPAEAEKALETEHEMEEFKEDLWSILAQAGITKKKIITILLIIVFGIVLVWFFVGNGAQETVEEGDDVMGEESAFGIVSSYVFGLEFEVPKTPIQAVPIGKSGTLAGVDTALYFGEGESDFENRFVYYIDLLRKMDSMYHTDVYSLIDLAVDRRAALAEHIDELDAIIQEGDNVYFEIQSRLESFDKEFEELAVDRDELEAQFFAATENLMPRSANDYLESFIEVQYDANELKAYYGAYRTVLEIYIAYLDLLEPRYQDIVANTEALIKGIRVFDVPASDIDAILPIEGEL